MHHLDYGLYMKMLVAPGRKAASLPLHLILFVKLRNVLGIPLERLKASASACGELVDLNEIQTVPDCAGRVHQPH